MPPAYPRDLRTLGDHLRRLLQKDVAAHLGVDKGSIYNWELNRTAPALRFIPGVVQFLGYLPFPLNGSLPERLRAYRREST